MTNAQQAGVAFLFFGVIGLLALIRWLSISRFYKVRGLKYLGGYDACGVGLAADEHDRKLVLVYMEGSGDSADLNAILTSSQARRLAEMLVIASKPGKTVADARRFARREKAR
ncbi:MAG: hypothetical protein ACXWAC_07615 [Usitatibacter sp.]